MVGFSLPCTISHPANHSYKYFGLFDSCSSSASFNSSFPSTIIHWSSWQRFWADVLLLSYTSCELCVDFSSCSGFQTDPFYIPEGVAAEESKFLPWATQRRCKPFAWTTRQRRDVQLWLRKMHCMGRLGRLKKQIGKEGNRMGSQEKDTGKQGRGRQKQESQNV